MAVLDRLPGIYGCWLPTNAGLPVRGRACHHHKHGRETLSHVKQSPCLYGFLSSYNNAFPRLCKRQISTLVKKNYNNFFSYLFAWILSERSNNISDTTLLKIWYWRNRDLLWECGKNCLRQILESSLLSQHCVSCQTHYLTTFSCHLCGSDSHTSTPLPCIFSCLVDMSSWRCSRHVKTVRF